jgi:hypothetical protein
MGSSLVSASLIGGYTVLKRQRGQLNEIGARSREEYIWRLTLSRTAVNAGLNDSRLWANSVITSLIFPSAKQRTIYKIKSIYTIYKM